MSIQKIVAAVLFVGIFSTSSIVAQTAPAKEGPPQLSLDAQSKLLVANDEMQVVFAIEREGTDLNAMNQAVLQALNSALADAKKVDSVKARMGSVYTNPNYTSAGKTNGWRVRGEISLTSQNFPALGNLAGQLSQRLQIAGVNFRLSDEARLTADKQLIKSAGAAFRAKAQDAVSALGYRSFELREMNLGNSGGAVVRQAQMSKAMRADSASMATEGGESEVTVSFSGTVSLFK